MKLNFYEKLSAFSDFNEVTESRYFTEVPDEWHVVMTDVSDSSEAIKNGKYRDVNILGAASISVIKDEIEMDFPYAFGGDGATLLLPKKVLKKSLILLQQLSKIAKEQFNLHLRVGSVPIEQIRKIGATVKVAKHQIKPGKAAAVFIGGGIRKAEEMIKADHSRIEVKEIIGDSISLNSLSCRWQEVPNKRGCVLSLLITTSNEYDFHLYNEILKDLNKITTDLSNYNPVSLEKLRYKSVKECIQTEKRLHSSMFSISFLRRFFEILICVGVFKYKIPPLFFDANRYVKSMRTHADFRKFDDMLRMVIDCSTEEAEQIEHLLKVRHQANQIYYGLNRSESSIMTCYVQGVDHGEHIHFIDGSSGGYSKAAKQMKSQIGEVIKDNQPLKKQ